MTIEALKYISEQLLTAGIPYEFGQWSTSPVPNQYWIGEYTESDPMTEDGLSESTFILTGTTCGSYYCLEETKFKIKKCFKDCTVILPNGNGLAVFYSGSIVVPTGDAVIKRLQVNLSVKEWSVN